jgi:vitamin B12/bleomycin/antimicrobial peptide transport system ATP-binding/permease protein
VNDSLNWPDEWVLSLVWTLKISLITIVAFVLTAAVVMHFTRWGRNFRTLTVSYFLPGRSPASWWPALTVIAMFVISIVGVRLQVLDSFFQNGLFTSFQDRSASEFYRFLRIFAVIAAVNIVEGILGYFVAQLLIIRWRVWLNDQLVTDWLQRKSYYRSNFLSDPVDNPDQRIQEDIDTFTTSSQTLLLGAVSAVISTCSFTVVLWGLSGPMTVFGVVIPRAMTFAIFIYVIAASVLVFKVSYPLIRLNFIREALTASFRYALVRLRDNSESVAFYSGEQVERRTLDNRFAAVIGNAWSLVYRNLAFQGVNFVVTQISVIIPFALQAPRFFSGAVTLGDMQQTAASMGQVHDALSFFRNSYDDFATYRATIDRLAGLKKVNAEARELPALTVHEDDHLGVEHLTVALPTGRTLIRDLGLTLEPGDTLLVTGASGSGKTTLLRSLAGLWPYADGRVSRPTGRHALFLSQRPYLPLGTLRECLHYPNPPGTVGTEILDQLQLSHLADQIDTPRDWARILSPGEQQRLGFARILTSRPRIAFLDEATSAVDEGIELMLYRTLRDQLPDCTVVSVGHHRTLEPLHRIHLDIHGTGDWTLTSPVPDPATR